MPPFADVGQLITVGLIQAGLGLAVGALLLRLFRMGGERYLLYWALQWMVMSAVSLTGVAALAADLATPVGRGLGLLAVLAGYLQPTALGLAALALQSPRQDFARDRAVGLVTMAIGLLLTALAGVLPLSVEGQARLAVAPSHLAFVGAMVWFTWAFARHAPRAGSGAGRLVIGFSLASAAHLLAVSLGWAGLDLYVAPTAPAVIGLLLPMGITAGIVLTVLQEATEAAERLRNSEATNRGLLAALPDMLVVLDREGVYHDLSPAKGFEPLVPAEQLLGRRADEVLPADLARMQRDHLARTLDTQTVQVFEYSLPHPAGLAHFEARLAPAGRDRVIGVVRDVTRRRRGEQEREKLIRALESKNDELAAKNAELERFTYTVSHDLRSPLVTILGFLGFAEKALGAGDAAQALGDLARVRAAATRMDQLLRELLELSRIGRVAVPSERVELGRLVREVTSLLAAAIRESRAEVRIADDIPSVTADRARLREVFQNLIENALRFSAGRPQPLVEVGTRGLDEYGHHILFVRDNGRGVEPVHHERIFGLFEKLDPATSGTGIGLALVRRIVEVHGGRVWVESEGRDMGATFCFTIPSASALASSPKPQDRQR